MRSRCGGAEPAGQAKLPPQPVVTPAPTAAQQTQPTPVVQPQPGRSVEDLASENKLLKNQLASLQQAKPQLAASVQASTRQMSPPYLQAQRLNSVASTAETSRLNGSVQMPATSEIKVAAKVPSYAGYSYMANTNAPVHTRITPQGPFGYSKVNPEPLFVRKAPDDIKKVGSVQLPVRKLAGGRVL